MKKQVKLKYLEELLSKMRYYNNMSPFPIYDTEHVEIIDNEIRDMIQNNKNYDEEPVEACKYCKSLHIIEDEQGNGTCVQCGAINSLENFKNIHEYLEKVQKKEDE